MIAGTPVSNINFESALFKDYIKSAYVMQKKFYGTPCADYFQYIFIYIYIHTYICIHIHFFSIPNLMFWVDLSRLLYI
jgi:hypothetical protein